MKKPEFSKDDPRLPVKITVAFVMPGAAATLPLGFLDYLDKITDNEYRLSTLVAAAALDVGIYLYIKNGIDQSLTHLLKQVHAGYKGDFSETSKLAMYSTGAGAFINATVMQVIEKFPDLVELAKSTKTGFFALAGVYMTYRTYEGAIDFLKRNHWTPPRPRGDGGSGTHGPTSIQ